MVVMMAYAKVEMWVVKMVAVMADLTVVVRVAL